MQPLNNKISDFKNERKMFQQLEGALQLDLPNHHLEHE